MCQELQGETQVTAEEQLGSTVEPRVQDGQQ